MKIATIPDVHGSHNWEKIIPLIDSYDKIVFLGDYVDTWENIWPDQKENLLNIIQFKKLHENKVDLLWGNHDTSYYFNEKCSGHQPVHAIDLEEIFRTQKENFQAIAIYDKIIFAHGGVSRKWMKCAGIDSPEQINQLFLERPNFFRWVGPNGFGDNSNEGPLWIRINSLCHNAPKGYRQVVGHTESSEHPKIRHSTGNNDELMFIDTRDHSAIVQINTDNFKVNLI